MKQLISIVTAQILRQIKANEVNMVRLESFDNPIIYKSVCENLLHSGRVPNLVPKLTLEKYREFEATQKPNWAQSINYLHKGYNSTFDSCGDASYAEKSFIDLAQAITKWRNEAPDLPAGSLVLLMGTEAAPDDKGSLKDTSFVISPRELIHWLQNDYSEWFASVLSENSIDGDDARRSIHTLYRAIFKSVNINIFKLSEFIDELSLMQFPSIQDLLGYICETLNTTWGIPSVMDPKYVPRANKLAKGRLVDAKIITNGINFIERSDDIPTSSVLEKLKKKFAKYALTKDIDLSLPFPTDTAQFTNYDAFERCVLDFMCGIDLAHNRKELLKVDYSIIDQIIGTKLPRQPSEKASMVTGEPMEAYAKMFLKIATDFHKEYSSYPTRYTLHIDRVSLPDCIEEKKEEAFMTVCDFMGGILTFFNSAGIEYQDTPVVFEYDDGRDPFEHCNYQYFKNDIRGTGKWGDPCKIQLKVKASNESEAHSYEYRWAFSPYSPWVNAFSYLRVALFKDPNSYALPSMVSCNNIQDYLRCESEDEFFAQLIQLNDRILYREHIKEVARYFSGNNVHGMFSALCNDFKDFALCITEKGLFSALQHVRKVVSDYSTMLDYIQKNYNSFTDVQKEKIALLINSFVITSNADVIDNCNMGEVLLPAYHPVMLEKIDAKQIFLRDGFAEIMMSRMDDAVSGEKLTAKLESLIQLSSITQGTDVILQKTSTYLTCKSMWEYYGVYYDVDNANSLISGNAFGSAIITDDEDAAAMLHTTPISNVVVRNIMDYIRTFPARVDGLNVAFIAPIDMQHIVAAVHSIAKQLESAEIFATINLRIICLNSKKNSASYLKRWLDSYFDDERDVKVNTYLRNITVNNKSDTDCLLNLLSNCDICFNYDVLQAAGVQFDKTGEELIDKEQAKFPMTFTPDTIPATHGKSRKVSISQFQFLSSKSHTQANFVIGNPHSVSGTYRTFKTLELNDTQNHIIEMSHKACKWVVCIDPAIDRRMLETAESRIIGFTTGEGSYGELNVTVSARNDILNDIKVMLTKRISEKFSNWSTLRLQKAAAFCVDEMSKHMDGSRILKALNPYDYEIHSFLAYILTLQMLGLTKQNDAYAVRALISLDSYKHWFAEDDELSKDNTRPDFMLIEIPKSIKNLDPAEKLDIHVKIIECKMGFQNDNHLVKAQTQLEKGLRTMSINWNPDNTSIMHRYWLNQLYRAIIFSPLNMDNTTAEYGIIRNKIYGILSGNYEIEWTGDIFAFWLDSNTDKPDEWEIDSTLSEELSAKGIDLQEMTCHCCGQMFIQKMLVPPEERSSVFEHNAIPNPEDAVSPANDDDDPEPPSTETVHLDVGTGESIPDAGRVYVPYLLYLNDGKEHSRKESLEWFSEYFSITPKDKLIVYESNGHYKWETVLDRAITFFRQNGLLENSALAEFHLTATGIGFAPIASSLTNTDSFQQELNNYKLTLVEPQDATTPEEPEHTTSPENESPAVPVAEQSTDNDNDMNPDKPVAPSLNSVRFLLGEDMRTKEKYYWEFGNKNLNNRHLLINGNSGCGKTYCIQTLLMEMVKSGVSGVVFDYTSGFTPDKLDPLFIKELGDRVQQRVVYVHKIPVNPFAKQTVKVGGIEVPEADTVVATRVANVFTSVYGFGGQQKSALYKAIKNGLKHHNGTMSFSYLEEELNDVSQKQAETVLSKIQPFLDLEPFADGEEFDWGTIRDSGGLVYVMQLDGFDRPTQLLLTELLLWDIWNYCVKNGNEDHPFVIVMDEAQNLSHGEGSPSEKILTEGRKFGISGWYATQFMKPQLSDDEIQRLQQAGQKLYFCPPDDGVMTVAKSIDIDAQGAKEWAPKLKALKKGECVTCGNMVKNEKWSKYDPRIIKVTSLQERLTND